MTAPGAPWSRTSDGVIVACRLTPGGGRDAIDGVDQLADGTLVLAARVRSAPQGGEANQALRALVADRLGAPASQVRVVRGLKSRVKQVAVSGDPAALIAKLETLSPGRRQGGPQRHAAIALKAKKGFDASALAARVDVRRVA
jgi:uncharacterized protein